MATQAGIEVKRFRGELNNLRLTDDMMPAKTKTNIMLDHWDIFFNSWIRYIRSGNVNELTTASQTYRMLEKELGAINQFFATGSFDSTAQAETSKASEPQIVTKEIIKEKEVIVKIRCEYCRNTYDEKLDQCPHCRAKR